MNVQCKFALILLCFKKLNRVPSLVEPASNFHLVGLQHTRAEYHAGKKLTQIKSRAMPALALRQPWCTATYVDSGTACAHPA